MQGPARNPLEGDLQSTPPSPAILLNYHGTRNAPVPLRPPWHAYVALVLCWSAPAGIVVLLCLDIVARTRGRPILYSTGLAATAVGSVAAVTWVILSYRAIVSASRNATQTLLMLSAILTFCAAPFMIPLLLALQHWRLPDLRELIFLAVNITFWFITASTAAWNRRLKRADAQQAKG